MKKSTYIIGGGLVATGVALALGLRKAGKVEQGILGATGGDAAKAEAAATAAKSAKTAPEVQAAAAKMSEAAAALPPTSSDVKDEVAAAASAAASASTPDEIAAAGEKVASASAKMSGNTSVQINATGYWPSSASESEKKMEGGMTGAASWNGHKVVDPVTGKRMQLHTIEEYLDGKVPYFSLSGDPKAWPWGQAVRLDWFDGKTILGRVVDTGSHFTGSQKVYRAMGREPLDCCCASKHSKILEKTTGTIIRGDHFDKTGRDIVASAFKGQNLTTVGALFMLGSV